MNIKLSESAEAALKILNQNGFEAYVVGGCVRDSLLNKSPLDWDITTNAKPDEIMQCFKGRRVIETGLKHGTITVLLDNLPVEITTYRIDGNYSDHRRPDSIEFADAIEADLSRRDFTVNALAYNPEKGIIDCFGGQNDLRIRKLCCVGDADTRFSEDALRILRAVRFSSTLGFDIEAKTLSAMSALVHTLSNVSPERISIELNKTLLGKNVYSVLLNNANIFTAILPELMPLTGDKWRHMAKAVAAAPLDLALRLTLMFCNSDADAQKSADIADSALLRLRYDNATRNMAVYLTRHGRDELEAEPKRTKLALKQMGEDTLRKLIAVQRANYADEHNVKLDAIDEVLSGIITTNQVFSLKALAVKGDDLISIGFCRGKELGDALNHLLDLVIDEKLTNEREALLDYAKSIVRPI